MPDRPAAEVRIDRDLIRDLLAGQAEAAIPGASALPLAEPLKLAVAKHFDQHQACPGNDDSGFGPPEGYASGLVAAATVGTFESDRCGIELRLTVPGNDQLDGKAVWFEYDPSTTAWQCSSEIDDKYLPSTCRG